VQIVELLRSMDIFQDLPEDRLQEIAALLEEQRVPAGTTLFREGDVGDSMLIVTAGRVRISTRDSAGRELTLAIFGDGEFFGETGVLTGGPRTADATAEVDSGVLVLRKDEFDKYLAQNPAVMRTMLKVISQRQMVANQRLVEDEDEETAGTKRGSGKIFGVFSPRGGSGKTMIATNLAVMLARAYPDRVALLDLSVVFGHASVYLGLQPTEGIAAIEPERLENLDRETLNKYAYLHSSSLRVYSGAVRPEEGEAVTGEHVKAVLELMRRQYLFVLVDLPSNFQEPTLAALELADKLILLMTPELSTMRDVREVVRLFGDTVRVPPNKQFYVLNQPYAAHGLSREQFEGFLELQVSAELPYAGESAYKALAKGEPLAISQPGSPLVKGLEKIISEFTEGTGKPVVPAQAGHSRGLFGRLLTKKS